MRQTKLPVKFKKGDSTFDKIKAYYLNPDENPLSETQEKIRLRWAEVLTLRLQYWTPTQIANKFETDYGLSSAQAYRDIRASESLFGDVLHSDKMGFRAILKEYTMKFYQRALKAKDLKMQAKALELMGKFSGAEEDDLTFNPEKLIDKEVNVNIDKKTEEAILTMLKGGSVDFNGLMNNLVAEETDFEDMSNEDR